ARRCFFGGPFASDRETADTTRVAYSGTRSLRSRRTWLRTGASVEFPCNPCQRDSRPRRSFRTSPVLFAVEDRHICRRMGPTDGVEAGRKRRQIGAPQAVPLLMQN